MRGGVRSTAIELATQTRSGAWVSRASRKAQTGMNDAAPLKARVSLGISRASAATMSSSMP